MAKLSDDEILSILKAEREASAGEGDELSTGRTRALDYLFAKTDSGKFAEDIPVEPGSSAAVSTDVSDAIETVLPDLIEIFTAGDNVVSFTPHEENDEKAAQQETEYVNHVFYEQNAGWMALYTNFKDALTSKTGVFKWWWEETEEWDEYVFEDKTELEYKLILKDIESGLYELADTEKDEIEPNEEGLYTFRCRKKITNGRAKVVTVAPEDFRIDRNASLDRETWTWAGHYSRPRVFQLLEDGFDRDKVLSLQNYDKVENNERRSRDYERDGMQDVQASHDHDVLRRVEIFEYHIWLDMEGKGEVSCWKIITGNEDSVILDKEQISGIQFSANCPYPITHKFYGRSLADLLLETQKIKTALTRLMLNSFYHSVNPRPEINMQKASRFTLSDLMQNKPGRPIRTDGENAIVWKTPPIVGDSVLNVLEYMSTVAENRTGVVRNAQGLNPDTLHDTAKGAMELMSAAQRRTRMVARILAETGVKDLFLGLHDLIVRHGRKAETVRLTGRQWVEIDPNKWARRKDLTIDVGLGSNTKSAELQFWGQVLQFQERAAPFGLADSQNIFNAFKKFLQAGNVRNPEMYFVDPEAAKENGEEMPTQPPDPETVKVQGELQLKQQEAQHKAQLEQAKAQNDFAIQQQRFQFEAYLALWSKQMEMGLAEQAAATEARLNEMAMRKEMQISEFKAVSEQQTKTMSAAISAKAATDKANAAIKNVRPGGKLG